MLDCLLLLIIWVILALKTESILIVSLAIGAALIMILIVEAGAALVIALLIGVAMYKNSGLGSGCSTSPQNCFGSKDRGLVWPLL